MQEPLENFKKEMMREPGSSFKPGFSQRVMESIAGLEAPRFEVPDLAGALWRAFRPLALASTTACLVLFLFNTYQGNSLGPVAGAREGGTVGEQAGISGERSQEETLIFEDWWGEVTDQIYGGML